MIIKKTLGALLGFSFNGILKKKQTFVSIKENLETNTTAFLLSYAYLCTCTVTVCGDFRMCAGKVNGNDREA